MRVCQFRHSRVNRISYGSDRRWFCQLLGAEITRANHSSSDAQGTPEPQPFPEVLVELSARTITGPSRVHTPHFATGGLCGLPAPGWRPVLGARCSVFTARAIPRHPRALQGAPMRRTSQVLSGSFSVSVRAAVRIVPQPTGTGKEPNTIHRRRYRYGVTHQCHWQPCRTSARHKRKAGCWPRMRGQQPTGTQLLAVLAAASSGTSTVATAPSSRRPRLRNTPWRISTKRSWLSRRNCLEFSRPWPRRMSP